MATVGVRFRPSERLRYVDDAGHDLKVGDRVTVDLGQGSNLTQGEAKAVVALGSGQVIFSEVRETRGVVGSVVSRAGPG